MPYFGSQEKLIRSFHGNLNIDNRGPKQVPTLQYCPEDVPYKFCCSPNHPMENWTIFFFFDSRAGKKYFLSLTAGQKESPSNYSCVLRPFLANAQIS